jgi:hypothetical protein
MASQEKNAVHHPYHLYPVQLAPNVEPNRQETYEANPDNQLISHGHPFPLSPDGPACLWGDCHATFPDRATLVQHIQYDHLSQLQALYSATNLTAGQQSQVPVNQPQLNALTAPNWSALHPVARPVTCQWANCSATFAPPNDVKTNQPEFAQNTSDVDIDMLLAHLFADHVPQQEEGSSTPGMCNLL